MTGAAVDEEDELVLDFCRLAGGAVEAEVDIFLKNFEEAGGFCQMSSQIDFTGIDRKSSTHKSASSHPIHT